MRPTQLTRRIPIVCTIGFFAIFVQADAQAGKPPRQNHPLSQTESAPTPMPMTILPPDEGIEVSLAPCCDHKCCKRQERKCKHTCEPVSCAPSIEYKGRPAPCSVTKIVSVTHPKSCTTVEVPVQIPGTFCREKVDRERDGDLELDYGKYEVSLRWRDGGKRLIVHYDD